MANEEQLAILREGGDVWNEWREENPRVEIDLSQANLFVANLGEADLSRANLSEADLMGADLSRASLIETDLCKANLVEANLFRAKLKGANFSKGFMSHTILASIDLGAAIGLETIKHYSPSSIDTDTIQQSKGKISVDFLRGCGLSDLDIAYAKLSTPGLDSEQISQIIYEIHRIYLDQPIRFYDCFISYNNKDEAFAQRLHDDLQDSGVRCWFALEDMKIGDRIRPTIDRQIRMREKLIVILSENSIQSEWVGDEVEAAIEQEKESGKNVLFPISLDNAVFETRDDWAAKIKRRRSIGNFSKWKDDAEYQKMFERLLRDLRASEE